jgi:Flp pilus assembly protein TadB
MKRSQKRLSDSTENISITSAPRALSTDLAARQRRYLISMIIRTICFLLTVALPSPYRWFALVGAMFLPYIAVVVANAGRETVFPGAQILSKRPKGIE